MHCFSGDGEFAAACVRPMPGQNVRARTMYQAYRRWCLANSIRVWSETAFGKVMPDKGFVKKSGARVEYCDVQLHNVPTEAEVSEGIQRLETFIYNQQA